MREFVTVFNAAWNKRLSVVLTIFELLLNSSNYKQAVY